MELINRCMMGPWATIKVMALHFHGLVQERRNSIANALELHLSCINPSISFWQVNVIGLLQASEIHNG